MGGYEMQINLEYSRHAFERCVERDIGAISSLDLSACSVTPEIKEGKPQLVVIKDSNVFILVKSNKSTNNFLRVATVFKNRGSK